MCVCMCSSSLSERDGIAIAYPKESLGDEVNSFFTIEAEGEGSGKVLACIQAHVPTSTQLLSNIQLCACQCASGYV